MKISIAIGIKVFAMYSKQCSDCGWGGEGRRGHKRDEW